MTRFYRKSSILRWMMLGQFVLGVQGMNKQRNHFKELPWDSMADDLGDRLIKESLGEPKIKPKKTTRRNGSYLRRGKNVEDKS